MQTINEQNSKITFNVAIVVSRFNEEITSKLLEGALEELRTRDFKDSQIQVTWVPGAIEIPVVAQRIAQQGNVSAIVALGAVIRGETTHYDYVCHQVSHGCQHVALQNDLPVVFGVLTTENEEQAFDRVGGKHGHKGKDAIATAVETVSVLKKFS